MIGLMNDELPLSHTDLVVLLSRASYFLSNDSFFFISYSHIVVDCGNYHRLIDALQSFHTFPRKREKKRKDCLRSSHYHVCLCGDGE
jgi:hypothetical protein